MKPKLKRQKNRLKGMRKHHNNKGLRQIRSDRTWEQVRAMARRLGVRYADS